MPAAPGWLGEVLPPQRRDATKALVWQWYRLKFALGIECVLSLRCLKLLP